MLSRSKGQCPTLNIISGSAINILTQADYFKGVIVSLDETGILQDHVYDPDEDEWQDGSLSSLKIKAHPESKLAITIHDEFVRLYYQCPSGGIAEATCDALIVWEPSKELSVPKPIAGAGICVASTDDSLCLSYVHQDGSLHRSTYQNGDWTGNQNSPCPINQA